MLALKRNGQVRFRMSAPIVPHTLFGRTKRGAELPHPYQRMLFLNCFLTLCETKLSLRRSICEIFVTQEVARSRDDGSEDLAEHVP
jgi:hypothetical protein